MRDLTDKRDRQRQHPRKRILPLDGRSAAVKTLLSLFAATALCCTGGPETAADTRPNILMIAVDDLRPELASFGASYIHSPHIDRLVSAGRAFRRHYVQAPTCGASRYTLLTGRYGGASNAALFERAAQLQDDSGSVPPSMPAWFRRHGYRTVSVGKVSHHPGGLGGEDWNDPLRPEMPGSWDRHLLPAGPWQHPRGWMHGLARGEIRGDPASMAVYQAADGPDSIYPDGRSIDEALRQLDLLTSDAERPFFLAVGILRPHLPFGAPRRYLSHYADKQLPPTPHPAKPKGRTTWHPSNEFMKYQRWNRDPNTDAEFALEVRRHYAACVTYADAQVGRLLERLQQSGASQNTVVLLWGGSRLALGRARDLGQARPLRGILAIPPRHFVSRAAAARRPVGCARRDLGRFPNALRSGRIAGTGVRARSLAGPDPG